MAGGSDSSHVNELLARVQNGDPKAENELFGYVRRRFELIAAKMYGVRQAHFSSSDMVQEACVRLLERLREGRNELFADTESFLAMSAQHLRWALLDLLRGRKYQHLGSFVCSEDSQGRFDPVASTRTPPEQLEAWAKFHELIDRDGLLTEEERRTVSLRWYYGLSQEEIAGILGVSVRSVKRYWHDAKEKLQRSGLDLRQLG